METSQENNLMEGLAVKSLEDAQDTGLDPRVFGDDVEGQDDGAAHGRHDIERGAKEKDSRQTSETAVGPEPLYVEFESGDKRNPQNFPLTTKWAITALGCYFSLLSAANIGSYNMGFTTMIQDFNCTQLQATWGLSLYALGFGFVPLVSASFSEEFGRRPLYVVSALGFMMMYVMVAEADNIGTVLVARFIQGGFGSTGSTMVGGTFADIWRPDQRGIPMALFAVSTIGGTGLGPVISGWIEMNNKLGWRWIQWIQMMIAGVLLLLVPLVMVETRESIILTRLAKRIRKETGDQRYRARVEDERASLRTLIYISCTRPVYLMFTEPVVASFSLWIGFAWGVLYCLIESIGALFRDVHGFNIGQVGTVFATMIVGCSIGFLTNLIQEQLYQKNYAKRGPEARLYFACIAAILFPAGMFIYAWTSLSTLSSWAGLVIGITVFIWACYVMYLSVFNYLAD
ncbi:hypothetical protein V5O48_014412, partial [Marasmius crinis-equi]